MSTLTISDKERFLINQEGQDFSHEAKTFIKIRELALKNLKDLDFPTKKLENWKYTNLRGISKIEFRRKTPFFKLSYIPKLIRLNIFR